jgi:uncharacterized protein (TIGR03435 family)
VAASLEPFADRPIVDMTGLKGRYDFAIDDALKTPTAN